MSAEATGGGEVQQELWHMADGSEIPSGVVQTTFLSLEALLGTHGALAAIDLLDVAAGRQPQVSPFGDMKSALLESGLCGGFEDGTIGMHDLTAAVVRNAVHVNPRDEFEWSLTDPREPFGGFDAQAQA